jgi:hypothetical protein
MMPEGSKDNAGRKEGRKEGKKKGRKEVSKVLQQNANAVSMLPICRVVQRRPPLKKVKEVN